MTVNKHVLVVVHVLASVRVTARVIESVLVRVHESVGVIVHAVLEQKPNAQKAKEQVI